MLDYSAPPWPADLAESARWNETRRRERLLSGRWAPDLEARLVDHFGEEVRGAIGPKSLAKNVFRKLCGELSVSYIETPEVEHDDGELLGMLGKGGLVEKVGFWPAMRHVQRRIVGLREMLIRIDWSPILNRPTVRAVRPDTVLVWASVEAPLVPLEIWELRFRDLGGRKAWCWDVFSIADPAGPSLRVHEVGTDMGLGADVTSTVLGATYTGDAYPFRWTQGPRRGEPFLPWSAYHAIRSGTFWDPYEGIEVVEGSLDVATAYTFLNSNIFHASWPQRWAIGAYVAGTTPVDGRGGPRTRVPVSPLSLLHLEAAPGVTAPQVGQWAPGIDVEALGRTIANLERATAEFDGLDASFIVKDAANPWSAAALSITREGKRQAQRTYAPELMPSDEETLGKLAAIANLRGWSSTSFPEDGYCVEYTSLPLSAEEAQLRSKDAAEKLALGLTSIVDVYMDDHPGISRDAAIKALDEKAADNKRWGVRPGTTPTPAVAGTPTPAGA